MNASLQQVGHKTVGEGKTTAVQNFIENTFMFLGVGIYTLAIKNGATIYPAISAIWVTLFGLVTYIICFCQAEK